MATFQQRIMRYDTLAGVTSMPLQPFAIAVSISALCMSDSSFAERLENANAVAMSYGAADKFSDCAAREQFLADSLPLYSLNPYPGTPDLPGTLLDHLLYSVARINSSPVISTYSPGTATSSGAGTATIFFGFGASIGAQDYGIRAVYTATAADQTVTASITIVGAPFTADVIYPVWHQESDVGFSTAVPEKIDFLVDVLTDYDATEQLTAMWPQCSASPQSTIDNTKLFNIGFTQVNNSGGCCC